MDEAVRSYVREQSEKKYDELLGNYEKARQEFQRAQQEKPEVLATTEKAMLLAGGIFNDFLIETCRARGHLLQVRKRINRRASITGHVFQDQVDVIENHVDSHPYMNPQYLQTLRDDVYRIRSLLATCLVFSGYRIGVIMVTSNREGAFSSFHLDQLVTAAQILTPYVVVAAQGGVFGRSLPLGTCLALGDRIS